MGSAWGGGGQRRGTIQKKPVFGGKKFFVLPPARGLATGQVFGLFCIRWIYIFRYVLRSYPNINGLAFIACLVLSISPIMLTCIMLFKPPDLSISILCSVSKALFLLESYITIPCCSSPLCFFQMVDWQINLSIVLLFATLLSKLIYFDSIQYRLMAWQIKKVPCCFECPVI